MSAVEILRDLAAPHPLFTNQLIITAIMIKQAIFIGPLDGSRAELVWSRAKNGSHEVSCRVYNSYYGGMMPIRNIRTGDTQSASWEFEHALDVLQDQGYQLQCRY